MRSGAKPCPTCGATASVAVGPRNEHGLCLACKTLIPLPLQKCNITPKKVLRVVVSMATIAMAVQVWMPEHKASIPRIVAGNKVAEQAPEITATLAQADRQFDADLKQAADWFAKHHIEPVK
jgi:hypothetical protein